MGSIPARTSNSLVHTLRHRWTDLVLRTVAIGSGLCAIALLMLPLLLVLLMLLFDSTAQGLLVLLGTLARWWQSIVPGPGGALPPYRALVVDPLGVAFHALVRAVPCLGGLALIVLVRASRPVWLWVLLLWSGAAVCGGAGVALALLPGLVAAGLLAAIDRQDRPAA